MGAPTFPSAPRRTASLLARATTLATLVLRMPAPVLHCSRTLVPAPTFPSAPRRTASLLARATTLATLVLRMPAPVLHCSRTLVPAPVADLDYVPGSCSDPTATYVAPVPATCSDGSITTEADCVAVGTCNDIGG